MDTKVTKIHRWYDKHTRSWVIQLLDKDDNQIGDADYSGGKKSSDYALNLYRRQYPDATII